MAILDTAIQIFLPSSYSLAVDCARSLQCQHNNNNKKLALVLAIASDASTAEGSCTKSHPDKIRAIRIKEAWDEKEAIVNENTTEGSGSKLSWYT